MNSNLRYKCGRTLDISKRLIFLPMHVREPAPDCIQSVRMYGIRGIYVEWFEDLFWG